MRFLLRYSLIYWVIFSERCPQQADSIAVVCYLLLTVFWTCSLAKRSSCVISVLSSDSLLSVVNSWRIKVYINIYADCKLFLKQSSQTTLRRNLQKHQLSDSQTFSNSATWSKRFISSCCCCFIVFSMYSKRTVFCFICSWLWAYFAFSSLNLRKKAQCLRKFLETYDIFYEIERSLKVLPPKSFHLIHTDIDWGNVPAHLSFVSDHCVVLWWRYLVYSSERIRCLRIEM